MIPKKNMFDDVFKGKNTQCSKHKNYQKSRLKIAINKSKYDFRGKPFFAKIMQKIFFPQILKNIRKNQVQDIQGKTKSLIDHFQR